MEEFRRIQKTGGTTYIISLPKKWAERNRITAGTQASITESVEGSLVVSLRPKKISAAAAIHCSISIDKTLPKVMAAYLAGARRIIIYGELAASVAEEARTRLSGIEIIEEKNNQSVLEVLYRGESLTTNATLQRMYSSAVTLFHLWNQVLKGKRGLEIEIKRRENEIDRLYLLELRILGMESVRPSFAINAALVAKTIERISDHIEQVCLATLPHEPHISRALHLLEPLFMDITTNFLSEKSSEETFERAIACERSLIDFSKDLEKAPPGKKVHQIRSVLERCIRISEYLIDLIEITEDNLAVRNNELSSD
ncbi:phosphate uptake regulator PhoU [Candidatus Micrarchaeota archaeon]|nr:phosphate uptake regulator PhoU [Candidatus Micrarchaeota archaeon]